MKIAIIDSHTGGEPTRVVLEGGLDLEGESMVARRDDFERRFDHVRSGIVNEPRGSEVIVGALLTPPINEGSIAGVIFFNNTGYLGMCGHGTIGVVETLRHLGRLESNRVCFDTPAGMVKAELLPSGEVQIENVASYIHQASVPVEVEGLGRITGDVAYGGNWFYIVHRPRFEVALAGAKELTEITLLIRDTLAKEGITGKDGATIDHVEVEGPSLLPAAHSKNFVMCPGGAYDRSPCGTGTSAKMACLYAAGHLKAGEWFVQESVTGSTFRGKVEPTEEGLKPTIVGRAFVTAESTLIFDENDPICWGLGT